MQIIYLTKVHTFIEDLETPLDARVDKMLDKLKAHGHELRMPFSKLVEDGIFELRVAGAVQVRLLYFFHKGEAVVIHAFFKKTAQLSRRDIAYALKIKRMFIADI